eukprot:1332549-Pyramimonas_sp.AAC.1
MAGHASSLSRDLCWALVDLSWSLNRAHIKTLLGPFLSPTGAPRWPTEQPKLGHAGALSRDRSWDRV